MQLVVEFLLSLGQKSIIIDRIIFEHDTIENDRSPIHIVLKPSEPGLYIGLVGLWHLHRLFHVRRHDIVIDSLCYLLREQDKLMHGMAQVIAFQHKHIAQHGPFTLSVLQIGMGGQGVQQSDILVDIPLEHRMLRQQQTGRDECRINGKDTL